MSQAHFQRQLTSDDGLLYGELVYIAYHGSVDDHGEVLQDGLDFGPKALSASRDNLIWPLAAGVWRTA